MGWLAFSFRGSVIVIIVESMTAFRQICNVNLRVLYLAGNRKLTYPLGGNILSTGNLKFHPHSDTLPPKRPYLLR